MLQNCPACGSPSCVDYSDCFKKEETEEQEQQEKQEQQEEQDEQDEQKK